MDHDLGKVGPEHTQEFLGPDVERDQLELMPRGEGIGKVRDGSRGEVVDHDDSVLLLQEEVANVGPDESGATRHEDRRHGPLPSPAAIVRRAENKTRSNAMNLATHNSP